MISKDQVKEYNEKGYLVLENFLPNKILIISENIAAIPALKDMY